MLGLNPTMLELHSRRLLLPTTALAALLFAGSPGIAEDWPEWRGAGRAGVWNESGLLERFPEDGLRTAWTAEVGEGYAGPAVAGGRVFVLDWLKDPETRQMEGRERVTALDEATGELLWRQEWPVGYGSLMGSYAIGPRATPTVDGNRVFVVGAVGDLLALDVASGEVLWSTDFVEDYGTSIPTWGVTSAPIVYGELLIAIVGGEDNAKVVAFDKRTGTERWRALSSDWEMGYGQPILAEAGGVQQLIVWEPQNLVSLDPATGQIYWSEPFDVTYGMTVATPVIGEAGLVVTQFYRGSMMMALGKDSPTATRLWQGASRSEMPGETDGLHSIITTPILDGDTIYGVCSYGELRALDAATGARLWESTEMTRQGRWGTAFMVRNGDRWFVTNDLGDLILARFSRQGYEEIDRVHLIDPTSNAGFGPGRNFEAIINWSHPAYANGHVVARNDKIILRASLLAD